MATQIFITVFMMFGLIAIILFSMGISILKFPKFWWRIQKTWLTETGIKAQKTKLWDVVLRRTAIIVILFGILFLILPFIFI